MALNPAAPLSVPDYILDEVDLALLMDENRSFGGQKYRDSITAQIKDLSGMTDSRSLPVKWNRTKV